MNLRPFDLDSFFKFFMVNNIKIVVLRNYENLPHDMGNDLDIEINKLEYNKFKKLLIDYIKFNDLKLYKYIYRPHVVAYKFIKIEKENIYYFKLDLHFNGASWYGLNYLTNKEIIKSSIKYKNWYIPNKFHELMMKLFVNILIGSKVPIKYLDELSKGVIKYKDLFFNFIKISFPGINANKFYMDIKHKNIKGLNSYIPKLKKSLFKKNYNKNPFITINKIIDVILSEIYFYLQFNGLFIVVVGPDGVGKTTLIKHLRKEMKSNFKNFLYFHWVPLPFSKLSGNGSKIINKKYNNIKSLSFKEKSLYSIIRITKNFIKANLLYYLRILPEMFRDRLVFGDRYFYPYSFDPFSVKYYGSKKLVRLFFKLIPKPHIIFILKADPEKILERKQELSHKQILEIYRNIENMKKDINGVQVVELNANQPIEDVTAEAAGYIFKYLIQRNKKRTHNIIYNKLLGYKIYEQFY